MEVHLLGGVRPCPPYVLLVGITSPWRKTTILLSPALHRRLTGLADERGQSVSELIRQACERQYGLTNRGDRLAAVEALAALRLPIGPVKEMIAESVSEPQDRSRLEPPLP